MNPNKQKPAIKHSLEILVTIGHHLKKLRLAKGFKTQEDFALTHHLPRIQYWRMEKGIANFTLKSLVKVLDIHGITIYEFFHMLQEHSTDHDQRNGRPVAQKVTTVNRPGVE